MAESDPVVKRRHPWWWLLGLVAALIVLAVLILVGWYHSTADLAAVREEAKQAGIPITVAEWNRTLATAEQRSRLERLAQLSQQLKDYNSELSHGRISGDQTRDRLHPFWPIPAQARAYHAELDQAVVTEALAILDAMTNERIVVSDGDPLRRPKNHIGTYVKLVRWLGERALLADEQQAIIEVRRLLRVVGSMDVQSDTDALVEFSVIAKVFPNIAQHLPNLRPHAGELVDVLQQFDQRLPDDVWSGATGSLVEMLTQVEYPAKMNLRFILGWDSRWWDSWLDPVYVRAGRSACLRQYIVRAQQVQQLGIGRDYVLWSERAQQEVDAMRDWHPSERLPKKVSYLRIFGEMAVLARTRLRLLMAELRQEPWPIDPFDPAGQALRPLKRDGVLIGAYSFGKNQIDDGGDRQKDMLIPLYGPLEPPPAPQE
jgi:hypothetical protein